MTIPVVECLMVGGRPRPGDGFYYAHIERMAYPDADADEKEWVGAIILWWDSSDLTRIEDLEQRAYEAICFAYSPPASYRFIAGGTALPSGPSKPTGDTIIH